MSAKNKNKAKSSKPVIHTQARVDERPRDIKQWQQMMVNPSAVNPVRTPTLSPYTGAVRTFTRTFSVPSNGVHDAFHLIMTPNAENSLAIMKTTPFVVDPLGWELKGIGVEIDTDALQAGFPTMYGDLDLFDSNQKCVGSYLSDWDGAAQVPFWNLVGDATTALFVNFAGTGTLLECFYRSGGVWTSAGNDPIISGTARINFGPFVGGFDGIMFALANPTQMDGSNLSIKLTSGTDPILRAESSYDLFSTDAVQLGKISTYRVTAASILCSYSGNDDENGGVIAAARTREGFKSENANPYEALTALQDHRFNGVLKFGAYAWWLPYDLEEMDPRPISHQSNATALQVAGHFDSADASLEVTIVMVVEFYSPLQIFEHIPGPMLDDNFVRAYHALDYSDAATCNPSHTKILKKGVSALGKTAKGLGKFVLSNPELLELLMV